MKKHLFTNFFLLLLVIGLGLFLFTDEIDQNGLIQLSSLSADTITQISIHHKQRDILLIKSDQQWRLTKPVDINANQFRIKTLLNLLSISSLARYTAEDIELKKYVLSQPETHITFNDLKIEFGIVNPINQLRYIKIDGEVHLTEDNFYPLLSSQIGTLIARELIPAEATITKLVLPENNFTRDDNDIWKSNKNISSDAIVEAIYQWQHKQSFAVHDYMQRDSLGEVLVYLKNTETPVSFHITDIDPWLIITRPEIKLEYHFNIEDYNGLLKPGAVRDDKQLDSDATLQVSPEEFINAIQSQ